MLNDAPTQPDANRKPGYALIWLTLAALIWRVSSGTANLYYGSNIAWMVVLAGLVCLLIGLVLVYDTVRLLARPGRLRVSRPVALLFFALPLAMSLLIAPRAFGVDTLRSTGGISVAGLDDRAGSDRYAQTSSDSPAYGPQPIAPASGTAAAGTPASAATSNNGTWTPDLLELDGAISRGETVGKQFRVLGFVYHRYGLTEGSLLLTRYITPHCAAEAHALGLLLTADNTGSFADDQWVWVTGSVETTMLDGKQVPVIKATSIEPANAPDDPYIIY